VRPCHGHATVHQNLECKIVEALGARLTKSLRRSSELAKVMMEMQGGLGLDEGDDGAIGRCSDLRSATRESQGGLES
jgi:hypothetical protein